VVDPDESKGERRPNGDRRRAPTRPRLSGARRSLSAALLLVGFLLLAETALTVTWQEPFSAIYARHAQGALGRELARVEGSADARAERRARRHSSRRSHARRRFRGEAVAFGRGLDEGTPLGRIFIEKLAVNAVLVEGADPDALTVGPGHYPKTALPGDRGTVGIAGHRTTFSAPFRRIDRLERGERIFIRMPYGLFTYEVDGQQIVSPDRVEVLNRSDHDRLVLTACHPPQSSAQRIVVFARLVRRAPPSAL
jgi:sortase A